MLMFLLLLFCSAAGHAQLYSSVWDGKLVSPPELQQQRSCILGCQLFTEFSHQQSTLPSTGYSVVSKGLGSQTNQHHTGRPGVMSYLFCPFERVNLPKARKQHKIETRLDPRTSFKYYCCCRAGLLLQQYAVPQHSHSSTLQYTRRQDSTRASQPGQNSAGEVILYKPVPVPVWWSETTEQSTVLDWILDHCIMSDDEVIVIQPWSAGQLKILPTIARTESLWWLVTCFPQHYR